MRLAVHLVPILLAVSVITLAAAAPPAPFQPLRFFEGRTEGEGRLSIAMRAPALVQVHGRGAFDRDGTLILRQIVDRPGKPSTRRTWRLREVTPGRYSGTLSDATGPVSGEMAGQRLHLAYRMKGGLRAEQWLTSNTDGSARNTMTIRLRGIVVARLDEHIRKYGR